MSETSDRFAQLLREDKRYRLGAYIFVSEALEYAQTELKMGAESPENPPSTAPRRGSGRRSQQAERHLTGQQLCEATRQYALEQYGYMAKCVLNNWGVHCTGDFGEIVFNLIRIGKMSKTDDDRREDFDDVFDFDADLHDRFEISPSE